MQFRIVGHQLVLFLSGIGEWVTVSEGMFARTPTGYGVIILYWVPHTVWLGMPYWHTAMRSPLFVPTYGNTNCSSYVMAHIVACNRESVNSSSSDANTPRAPQVGEYWSTLMVAPPTGGP